MKRYIALLRGINISGKNKIAMSELKEGVTELGFEDVVTYLNSGNVIFCSDIDDKGILSDKINGMIKDRFDLDIPVFIILQEELKELLDNAPDWWGMMIKRYTTTLYLSCRFCLVKMFVMKLESLKLSMRKYIVVTVRFFGNLFARIIERLIGGREL